MSASTPTSSTSSHAGATNEAKRTVSDYSLSNTTESKPTTPRPCAFFARGLCKFGESCRFSHDLQLQEKAVEKLPPPPLPIFVNIPAGHQVFSIDVECVATGIQHNARSIAQVSLVDQWGRLMFNSYIKQDVPVVSYLTQLTGITKELLEEKGMPLADAMAVLRSFLSPTAILVGQSIMKDVQWLQLARGVDYHSMIDLSDLFRVWSDVRGGYINFSQDHCAKVWLGLPERPQHDAVTDAMIAMSLFNAYVSVQWDINRLHQFQRATLLAPRIVGFSSKNPVIDGCCMGNRNNCICGAPFD
eukprot:gene1846-2021_t